MDYVENIHLKAMRHTLAQFMSNTEDTASINELELEEGKNISKGTQITYAKGKQPEKTAYMVEYNDHPYNKDFCVVTNNEEDLEDKNSYFVISKRWIKTNK
jgi:ribosomal protein S24E